MTTNQEMARKIRETIADLKALLGEMQGREALGAGDLYVESACAELVRAARAIEAQLPEVA